MSDTTASNTATSTPAAAAAPAATTAAPAPSPGAASSTPAPSLLSGDATKPVEAAAPTSTEAKPETKADAQAGADIELKFPEGMKVDEVRVAEFKKLAKDISLDSAKAQKLYDYYAGIQAKNAEAAAAEKAQQVEKQRAQVTSDKELGGANLDKTIQLARRGAMRFGGDGLIQKLHDAGLGDDIEVIRFLRNVGAASADDTVAGTTTAPNGKQEPSLESLLYRNTKFAQPQ